MVGEGRSSCLSELKLLPKLAVLCAEIENARCIPTDFCFPNLQFCRICVGPICGLELRRHICGLELRGKGEDGSVTINTFKNLLPNIQYLNLNNWDNWYSLPLFNFGAEGFLQKLEILEVQDCNKMKSVFGSRVDDNESGIIQLQSLEDLTLQRLPDLKHRWKGPTRFMGLRNLIELKIFNCPTLTSIFPSPALAGSLQQLQILKVERCVNLEEVISGCGDDIATSSCCCLTNFRELDVSYCGKVKTIIPITCRASHPQSRICRLPNLEKIILRYNKELRHVFGHETEVGVECPSLQDLLVWDCPKMCTTHFVATPSAKPSNNVSLDNIQLQGVYQQLQNTIICFSSLKTVKLKNCNKLKQVFTTTSLLTSLPLLQDLHIQKCNELEEVIVLAENGAEKTKLDTPLVFQKLKTLKVIRCGKLKTIFPISAALEELYLDSNGELEHVFGESNWDCTSQYPALTYLHVVGCPKICAQCAAKIQNLSTTKRPKVRLWDIQGVEEVIRIENPNDDNNDDYGSRLEVLSLGNLVDLKCIWRGPTQNMILSYLREIEVIGCKRLKHFFPITMTRSLLPDLEKLIVRRCNELEQVIFTVEDGNEVWFEKLEVIYVSECEKLKTILSTFVPLPNLKCLRLESNAELEHLFGEWECSYTSTWPHFRVLAVAGCPKINTQAIAIIKSQL